MKFDDGYHTIQTGSNGIQGFKLYRRLLADNILTLLGTTEPIGFKYL